MRWKFWKCLKTKNLAPTIEQSPTPGGGSEIIQIDVRRKILDWRDLHCELIERRLRNNIDALFLLLREKIEASSATDFFFRRGKLLKQQLEPVYHTWVKDEISGLIRDAENDLQKIITQSISTSNKKSPLNSYTDTRQYLDTTASAAMIIAGLGAIPAVKIVSTVSAGGILGFFGVTVFSWPIALGASFFILVAIALGSHRAYKVRGEATDRYMERIKKDIREQVLGTSEHQDSVCRRAQDEIESVARDILSKGQM